MRRWLRLVAPACSFAALATLFIVGRQELSSVRGGLLAAALWTIAVQITVAAIVVCGIDDLTLGTPWVGRGRNARFGSMREIGGRPTPIGPTLCEFYRWPMVPVFILTFGIVLPIVGILEAVNPDPGFGSAEKGTFIARDNLPYAGIFIAGALLYLILSGVFGYLGYVLGAASAITVGKYYLGAGGVFADGAYIWARGAAAAVLVGLILKWAWIQTGRIRAGGRST